MKDHLVANVAVDSVSYLMVCVCREPHGNNVIPLKDLVPTLREYVGSFGGEGQLQILMCYKDKNGDINPINEEMVK